ncbi:MAG: hypothetical protein F6K03_02710 [Kamptonema sp. SIO4C4]|nr:hypothetical protein [Kamptonema sp. SIO4C4]
MFEAFIYIIGFLLILILSVIVYLAEIWRRQRNWLKKFAPDSPDMQQCTVGYITQNNIAQEHPKAIRDTIPGILQYDQNQIRCLIPYDEGREVKTFEFDRQSHLALLTVQSWIAQFPPLLRLLNSEENQTYYFVATNTFGFPDTRKTQQLFQKLASHVPSRHHHYGQSPRWVTPMVIFTLVATVCIVGSAFYSGSQAALSEGPGFVEVTNSGDVFTTTRHSLYHLDAQGNLQNRYSLPEMGIKEGITDLHALNRNQLLLADWQTGTIQLCQLNQPTCNPLPAFQGNSSEAWQFQRAIKFVVDRKNSLIYATNTAQHSLVALTLDGNKVEQTRGQNTLLCYPNGITLSRQGKLAIADSNNFRILTWSRNRQGLALTPDQQVDLVQSPRPQTECTPQDKPKADNPIQRHLNAFFSVPQEYDLQGNPISLPVAEEGRVFPTFVEQDYLSFWWVLIGDRSFSRDNVLRFDANWENPLRINFPDQKDIAHMAIGTNQVLLALPEHYLIRSISLDDLSVRSFGKEDFQQALQEEQQSKWLLQVFYYAGILIAGLGALLLLVLALWEQRQKAIALARLDPTLEN